MRNPYILSLPIVLAAITGMLATDLYLPAVPALHSALGGTAVQAQYTLASFMGAFAIGQLIVGAVADRVDKRTVMLGSFAALTIVSLGCALVGSLPALIVMRALQGFAAAASVALAPAMLRELGDEMTTIKLIGFVSSIEAVVPAAAPALGVWLIGALGWQASFYAVALMAVCTVSVFAFMPRSKRIDAGPPLDHPLTTYLRMLTAKRFMAFTLGHAFGIGALLTFIFSAPYVLTTLMQRDVAVFAWMQVFLVGSFIVAINVGPWLIKQLDAETMIIVGGLVQLVGGISFLTLTLMTDAPSATAMTVAMIPVNVGLGLRAGPTFTRAMDASGAPDGSTGALMIFIIALVISAGTSTVAPFLHLGVWIVGFGVAVQLALHMTALLIGLSAPVKARPQAV